MDYIIKLIILFLFSFSTHAAWNTNFRGVPSAAENNNNSRNIIANMRRTITASQYKTINNYPQKSVFNAPVPYSAPATLSRGLSIPKKTLGAAAKRMALGGARFGAYGVAFEAAALIGGYVYEEYVDGDTKPDGYVDGDYKDIVKKESVLVDDGNQFTLSCRGYQGGSPYATTDEQRCAKAMTSCGNGGLSGCHIGTGTHGLTVFYSPTYAETTLSKSPEEVYDDVIDSMSDEEFNDYINSPQVKPQIVSSPEFSQVDTDVADDFSKLTDTFPNGLPDTSTLPTTFDQTDNNLDTLSVPEYDQTSLTDTTIEVSPEYNTIVDTQTSTQVDPVNFTETKTIVTTTTTVDSSTGDVVDSTTKTETKVYPRPDLNPNNNPNPDPDSSNPNPDSDPTSSTTETTNTKNPSGPIQVEVVNMPPNDNVAPPKVCEENPNALGCLDVGNDLPKPPDVADYEMPFEVTPFSLSGTAQCPPPVAVTLLIDGKTYYIEYQPFCDFAIKIKPIIIALAFLLSFYIVTGATRRQT